MREPFGETAFLRQPLPGLNPSLAINQRLIQTVAVNFVGSAAFRRFF
jgi:hypothetical protein